MPEPANLLEFESLFKVYANRNAELASVAYQAYVNGRTIAQEPSAAMTTGLIEAAIERQRTYIADMTAMVEALHAKPVPDLPASHPIQFPIALAPAYDMFVEEKEGRKVALNPDTALLAQFWMIIAVELAKSQSASLPGSLIDADYKRAINNLGTLSKLVEEYDKRPIVDMPETSRPGSVLTTTGVSTTK